MRSAPGALCLLSLSLWLSSPCGASPQLGNVPLWRSAEPGWHYEFPRDHGPHREFRTEWWYATGTLLDEGGREYGFQLTFFRQGIRPGSSPAGSSRFRVNELPFAHFALSDISDRTFRHYQRTTRAAFGEAGFGIPPGRLAWMEDWVLETDPRGGLHLKASQPSVKDPPITERGIDLTMASDRPPLLHGKEGVSPKSSRPGHSSHYYSLTRLQAAGTVTIHGKVRRVRGLVWFDHEWATNSLDSQETGWDWSGLHLDNGDDLMIFRIRDRQGLTAFTAGTLRDASGRVHDLEDLEIRPTGSWKSPHTKGIYPAGMDVRVPSEKMTLTLTPKLPDQELLLPPFAYWEGAVRASGSKGDAQLQGEGYLELTGYGGEIMGVNGK